MIPASEYQERVKRFAAGMRQAGLDAVLLTAESNIDYFSGYRHHAPWTLFARPFFTIISADGRGILLTHTFLEPEARRTSSLEVRSFSQSGGAPVSLLAEILRELGLTQGALGMELGYEQRLGISIEDFRKIEALPGVHVRDVSELIWRLRMIKSPAEIELLTKSAEITTEAFRASFEAARPGMTEADLGRIAAERMMHLGAERPGLILVTSGRGNYGILSGKPTDRKLQRDEMVWMDMGAVYKGYWSDFCRAAYLGSHSDELDNGQAIINDVNRAATEASVVGNTMRDVAAAAESAFAKNGLDVKIGQGRIGHGIGLMSTEPPHVALYDETVCEDGLVFTIEPRFVTDNGVFNCEELILVTKSGPKVLTSAPRDLQYVG
jgi:Xaa-Pro aminopeptidase